MKMQPRRLVMEITFCVWAAINFCSTDASTVQALSTDYWSLI